MTGRLFMIFSYQLTHTLNFFWIFWAWDVWTASNECCGVFTESSKQRSRTTQTCHNSWWNTGLRNNIETKAHHESQDWNNFDIMRKLRSLYDSILNNRHYYLGVLRCLREAIGQKRPNLWQNNCTKIVHLPKIIP